MIHTDKDALLCDLAETYGIYDIGSLPTQTVAILSCGLRDNSRIKMKMTGTRVPDNILLLAHAVDRLSLLVWQQTKDGQHNRNRPDSIAEMLLYGDKSKTKVGMAFNSPEEFWAYRNKLLERK